MGASKSKNSKRNNNKNEVDLAGFQARVDRVHINGIQRTYDDYINRAVQNLFKAKTFNDMLFEANSTSINLMELGIFKNIAVQISVSKEPNYDDNGYEVTFIGKEYSRVTGNIGTELNHNEGVATVNLASPNLFGRGERISVHGSYGHKHTTDINLRISKPFYHTVLGDYKPELSVSLFKHSGLFPWSKYKTQNLGVLFDCSFQLPFKIKQNYQLELAIREISTIGNKQIPMSIRSHCGPRLVSILRNITSFDQRDNSVFPTEGIYINTTNEIAGLAGGNVAYMMNNTHCELNIPFFAGISGQLCCRFGAIRKDKKDPIIPINNLFTMGGPLSLRGFNVGGATKQEDGAAIGSNTFWCVGCHLWAPLPFNSYFGRFGDRFRTHLFYNFGSSNIFSLEKMRSATGMGIAVGIGDRARIEFNYCMPLDKSPGDNIKNGFQFGIGYEFL